MGWEAGETEAATTSSKNLIEVGATAETKVWVWSLENIMLSDNLVPKWQANACKPVEHCRIPLNAGNHHCGRPLLPSGGADCHEGAHNPSVEEGQGLKISIVVRSM